MTDSQWINVGERLPETEDAVLVFHSDLHDIAYYIGPPVLNPSWWTGDETRLRDVTHWQSLPASPE